MNIEIAIRESAIRRGRFWSTSQHLESIRRNHFCCRWSTCRKHRASRLWLDSFIESASGGALLWRLHLDAPEHRERAEYIALKLVGISFLLLAAYVAFDAIKSLIKREPPEASYIGIAIAALSLVVMPFLARAKRQVAATINSRAMKADSRQTDLCAYLSAILLGGLILNALFGWWWADPLAALVMTPIVAREGIEALRGESCDDGCH